jgi:SAM-dependent methyltransferase
MALWLYGASQVTTVDLNPYLRPELIRRDLEYIRQQSKEIMRLFGAHAGTALFRDRFNALITCQHDDVAKLLDIMNIRYLAPADATTLNIKTETVDYHISFNVLEHIPPATILDILREAKRVLRREGALVHLVDLSDHFSHSDHSISSVNFLQFSEDVWMRYSGNRYMYHNRLRVDDLLGTFYKASLKVASVETAVDPRAKQILDAGFPLSAEFRGKASEVNATRSAWVVARNP